MAKPKLMLTLEQIAKIKEMAGLGLTVSQMAALLHISKKTFERIVNRDSQVKDALENGRASAGNEVMKTAYRMAVSGRQPAMTMFWLKCRERWSEIQRIEHSGPDGKAIETHQTHADVPDAELNSRIQALLSKREKEEG